VKSVSPKCVVVRKHNKFIKYRYGQKTAFTGRAKNARHL
jgi:hypothetical protein